jgi:hypothetical protein
MKKFLALTLTLASVGFAAVSAEAKAAGPSNSMATVNVSKAAPAAVQWNRREYGRNRVRVRNYSRLVRRGRQVWRETYQVRYLPNGRTVTRLMSRVRVR